MDIHNRKILITAFDFFPQTGGVATYAWELAESLGRQGFQVLVVAKHREGPVPKTDFFDIEYVNLPSSGLPSFPFLTLALKKIFLRWKPQKVICTLWMPGATASIFARWLAKQKNLDIYAVVHAMEILDPDGGFKAWVRKRLRFLKLATFRRVQKVFCVSQFSKDLVLKETGISTDRVHIIHNGVNAEKFSTTSRPPAKLNHYEDHFPILLTVARLMPHKGIDAMLESLPAVIQKFPKTKYLIGGNGPDRQRLEGLVDTLDLRSNVEFLGFVPDEELPTLYGLADLFVLLSRESPPYVEGFGLVFLEAAACKTPSLGGRSGGIPDAIIEGKTGWLVSPTNTTQISQKILEIGSSPSLLETMGEDAYTYTRKNRRWKHVCEKIVHQMYTNGSL